jgi:Luciferase-like monooxygenase
MKFGLQHPIFSFDYSNHNNTSQIVDSLKNLATRAENIGFDSFWVMDHFHQIPFIGKPEEPVLEGWTTLSVLAGITTKIKLGKLVTGVIYRYPSVLAKIAATLDVLSKGRLFMGIGASYFEGESSAYVLLVLILFRPIKRNCSDWRRQYKLYSKCGLKSLLLHSMENIIKFTMHTAILSQYRNLHHLSW